MVEKHIRDARCFLHLQMIRESYGEYLNVFQAEIPRAIRIAETSAYGQSIYSLYRYRGFFGCCRRVTDGNNNTMTDKILHKFHPSGYFRGNCQTEDMRLCGFRKAPVSATVCYLLVMDWPLSQLLLLRDGCLELSVGGARCCPSALQKAR